VPVIGLALSLGHYLQNRIEDRALDEASRAAELVAELGIQPQLTPLDMRRGLTSARVAEVDQSVQTALDEARVVAIRVWNPKGWVVYAEDRALIGKTYPRSHELKEALSGLVAVEVSELGQDAEDSTVLRHQKVLEVYVPLRFGATDPKGAFEISLPYAPIAATVREETRTVYLILFAGFAFLYAAMFKIVAGASKKLRRQAQENEHQALHDPLTGLPNRTLFRDRTQQAILAAQREGTGAAVLIMDLDRFKEVNDTLGHHSGDELLKELGNRLNEALRESDSIARLGGDEFGVLLPRITSVAAAVDVAERIHEALREPFVLQGFPLAVEASVGAALFPDHAEDVDTLIQHADVAMYLAKAANTDFELYDEGNDEYDPSRLTLIGELRRALEENEIALYYQPKAGLRTGHVTGVEVLVRWQHPERGLLYPDEFIPLAQHVGLIKPFTLYVIDKALAQCAAWSRDGLELRVAVNLAMRNLLDLEFPDDVAELLEKWKVEAERLELEITESTIMADPFRARQVLTSLSEMGVRLSIDDFGTGYSSLSYLRRLPVQEIKIDKSFVMNMTEDENDAVIVRSTIDLARNLGLEVVAEGVENARTWSDLESYGCDIAQGFFLSRPLLADELAAWLRENHTVVSTDPEDVEIRRLA